MVRLIIMEGEKLEAALSGLAIYLPHRAPASIRPIWNLYCSSGWMYCREGERSRVLREQN